MDAKKAFLWYKVTRCNRKLQQIYKSILKMTKYQVKDKYDLEDSVNDFLIYYNNKRHSTTEVSSY